MINKSDLLALITIAAIYLLIESIGITCPIKWLTGISCGGCGMSRAYFSLLKGDVLTAFHYHPLFPLPPIILLVLFFRKKISERLFNVIIALTLILFVVVYFVRLADSNDLVVVCNIGDSVLVRLFKELFNVLL